MRKAGMELTMAYLNLRLKSEGRHQRPNALCFLFADLRAKPNAGGYLERYGFVSLG